MMSNWELKRVTSNDSIIESIRGRTGKYWDYGILNSIMLKTLCFNVMDFIFIRRM